MTLWPSLMYPRGLFVLALALGLLGSACEADSSSAAATDSGPDADPEPTCEPATRPGERVLVACAQQIELDVAADGLPVPRPVGSTCDLSATYTLALATRTLTWRECDSEGAAGSPWIELSGKRVLTQREHEGLLEVLRTLDVQAPSNSCGADKPTITVSIETDSGAQEYLDAFYACRADRVFVAPVDSAVAAFAELAVEEEPVCCDAIPQCDDGTNYATKQDCEASEAECESRTVCCSTIWCAVETACDALDELACGARTDCQTVSASPVQEDGGTADRVFIACLPDDDGCADGDLRRCASETADGPLYNFPTQCIPPSWVDRGSECD